jgi:nucleoside-diphosphate-sugar epimerase
MQIAITGATGFLGRYLVAQLGRTKNRCRCWYRPASDRSDMALPEDQLDWVAGELGDPESTHALVEGCDAVVHSALYHPAGGFMGGEGDLIDFAQKNIIGSLMLMEAARRAGVKRFIFISTCAVHDKILHDRWLDESHPLWPKSHYGAHKAALEKFVHSYGLGQGWPICALRPTGIYGLAHPPENSKWFGLVQKIARGEDVECSRGGKEVHAADVAKAVAILLTADGIAGEAYSCYDRYVSEFDVANIAKELTGSGSQILGQQTKPRHRIVADKIKKLGMEFGGDELLKNTIQQIIDAARQNA